MYIKFKETERVTYCCKKLHICIYTFQPYPFKIAKKI